jgi:hypothetical protein
MIYDFELCIHPNPSLKIKIKSKYVLRSMEIVRFFFGKRQHLFFYNLLVSDFNFSGKNTITHEIGNLHFPS